MNLSQRLSNMKIAYSKTSSYLITIIAALLLELLQLSFTDFPTIAGNLGMTYAIIEGTAQVLLSLLFGMNIALLWYKLKLASSVNVKEGGSTAIGSIIGIIVSGCPACSITIASYLGLASILSSLPFFGLEVKLLGIIIVLYATDSLAKNLTTCKAPIPVASET